MSELTYILFCIFPIAVVTGGFYDMLTMTIPNKISLVLVVAFFPVAWLAGLPLAAMGMHVLAFAIVLFVGMALFAFGYIGGGDVKLLAAASLWIGMEILLSFVCIVGIIGGALSVGLLVFRAQHLPMSLLRVGWVYKAHQSETGVPYGLAIASGAMLVATDVSWMAKIIA